MYHSKIQKMDCICNLDCLFTNRFTKCSCSSHQHTPSCPQAKTMWCEDFLTRRWAELMPPPPQPLPTASECTHETIEESSSGWTSSGSSADHETRRRRHPGTSRRRSYSRPDRICHNNSERVRRMQIKDAMDSLATIIEQCGHTVQRRTKREIIASAIQCLLSMQQQLRQAAQ
ncbi:ORF78R [Turbot reddish body iridovirus]|uniref:ORF78R n=1 Tax=Turbot reddish body iridovirus TaxID=273651 RepID=E2CU23_ISKNV|nr:ORF78R [Turbot reddish body iridovirus]